MGIHLRWGTGQDAETRPPACFFSILLDEIFKANSAILNALLTLLNERCFDNGRERIRVPLVCVVGASNELPESSDLGALFDRFLVRCFVEPVSSEAFDALLTASSEWEPPSPRDRLSLAELDAVRRESRAVEVPPEVRMFLRALRDLLREEGFEVSDRRWRKLLDLLRVAAAADGRARVALADCGLARWCIWSEPPQLSRMTELLTKALDVVHLHEVSRIDDVSSVLLAKVDEEAAAEEQVTDESGQLLWRDENGREGPRRPQAQAVTTTGDPLYVAPAEMERDGTRVAYTFAELWERHYSELPHGYRRLEEWTANPAHQVMTEAPMAPVVRPRRFSREHVESRRAQLEAVQSDVAIFLEMFEPEAEQPSLWPRLEVSDLGKAIADAQARLARVARGVARALEQVAALEVHDP